MKYEVDVILRIATLRGFANKMFLLSKSLNLSMKQSS